MQLADEITMIDNLDVIDVFGSKSSSDSDERNLRLMKKSKDAARKKARQADKYTIDVEKEELLECLCPNCGHVFYRKLEEEDVSCPYCQMKHHFEEAEEVHLTRQDEQEAVKLEKLAAKDKQQKRKQRFIVFKPLDTHENDAKTQTSLQMGTVEYNEYVEDLQESNPARPDDAFPVDLESRNATLREEMVAVASGDETGDLFERKAMSESAKRDLHDEALAAAMMYAGYTESKKDDYKLSKIGIDNPLVHDMGVSPEDYQETLEEFTK